jgi:uncharacterized protein with PIN domain
MKQVIEAFDDIDICLECGKPIKVVKLKYIKKKIVNISDEDLMRFKYCNQCKRKITVRT